MKNIIKISALVIACLIMLTACELPFFTSCKHDDPDKIVVVEGREPTCNKKGISDGLKCEKCGIMVVPQTVLEEIDCIESDWIIDLEPTEEAQGRKHTECTMCKTVIAMEIIPVLGSGSEPPVDEKPDETKVYKLGLGVDFGHHVSNESNLTFAAVVLDKDGRIVACKIDALQIKYSVDFDSETVQFTNLRTKKELGDEYNLKIAEKFGIDNNGDGIVLEWYQQAAAFEKHVIGKTVEEVANMPLQTISNGHIISAEDSLLSAGCTIQITEFINAVVKACNDEQGVVFSTDKEFALGFGADSLDDDSRFIDDGCEIKAVTHFATSVVSDGKIVASLNDAIQTKVVVDWDLEVIEVGNLRTKREKKEDYAMSIWGTSMDNNGDGIVLEWYQQSAAFSAYVVGMTAAEIKDIPLQTIPNGYIIAADDVLLSAGCTIMISEMMGVVVESIDNAVKNPDDNTGNGNNGDNNGGNNDVEDNKTNITIWVSDLYGVKELAENQVKRFLANHPEYSNYKITITCMYEADAPSQVLADITNAPDVYCFAQDQLIRLVQGGALSALDEEKASYVNHNNDSGAVNASMMAGKVYAYPYASDNGYYMYYDTSIITNPDSLEQIIADVEAYNAANPDSSKCIRFALENAWYTASFFFAVDENGNRLCYSGWTTDTEGNFIAFDDNFNSANGLIAMRGMMKLAQSSAYNFDADTFSDSAVWITGMWNAHIAEEHFGKNFAATDLPSFTVDGKSYHLGSFSGNKLMGVKPQSDPEKEAFLHELVAYLTGEECQMERYQEFGWGPSNIKAQGSQDVSSDKHLSALAKQNQYAVPQGNIHGSWWDIARQLGIEAQSASNDEDLRDSLDKYDEEIHNLFKEKVKTWSLIGDLMDSNWAYDFPMHQVSPGVWETDVLTLAYGNMFRLRYGGSWEYQIGANGKVKWDKINMIDPESVVSEVDGKYIIRLEWDGISDTAAITFIPVEE